MKRSSSLKELLSIILRALVTLALLALLLNRVAWQDIWGILSSALLPIIAFGCGLYYCNLLVSCYKWRLTLALEHLHFPFWQLVRWYLIGSFASNFLPTDIGGDLGRGYYAGRASGQVAAVARSIIVERLTGLLAMLVLAVAGFMWISGQLWVVALLFLLLMIAAICFQPAMRFFQHRQKQLPAAAQRLAHMFEHSIKSYRAQPGLLLAIVVISLFFQILAGLGLWLNLQAVRVDLPFQYVVLINAMVGIVSLLPISINGWGIREGLLTSLLTPLGAPAAGIVAGALLGRALVLLLSAPGAFLLPFERK